MPTRTRARAHALTVFAYNDKNEVYSGYFPEPIYLESDDFNSTNEPKDNTYHLLHKGKPFRQVSNEFSKYNNEYFLNMRHAFKLSQCIYNKKPTSSSRGTIDTSIGIEGKW